MVKTVAIIVAAGQGKRMGTKINKQYLRLQNKPVLAHTLEVFEKHPLIDEIIVVAKKDEITLCTEEVIRSYNFVKVTKVVAGGKERQDSVYNGLKVLPDDCDLVVVHDGARPLITKDVITEGLNQAKKTGAVIVAVPVKDTIKRVDEEGNVLNTLVRSELWAVQTPQIFKKDLIIKAYENAYKEGTYGTDDASLVEGLGKKVSVVKGDYANIKITTPEDIKLAETFLKTR